MQHWRLLSPIFHHWKLQTKMCSTNPALQSGSPNFWRKICTRPEKLARFQPSVNSANWSTGTWFQSTNTAYLYKPLLLRALLNYTPQEPLEGFICPSADRGAKGMGRTWTVSKHRTCYITFNTCTILINQTCFICFLAYYMAIPCHSPTIS